MAKGMGGMGDMGEMMRQAQQMMKQREKVLADLKERIVEASSGGGMVTAYVNGARELVKIGIEREVVDPDDKEMLEDLVVAAVNEAMRKAQELSEKEMARIFGSIPGLGGLI